MHVNTRVLFAELSGGLVVKMFTVYYDRHVPS